jgi:hypothetical protein
VLAETDFHLCLGLLGFSHLGPALSLSFGDAATSFLAQDPFGCLGTEGSPRAAKRIQRPLDTLHLVLETQILCPQRGHYVVQVSHELSLSGVRLS